MIMQPNFSAALNERLLEFIFFLDFSDCISSFSLHLTISLRSYIKHLKECFIEYPNLNTLL